jgi:hypothetical protein
MVPGNGSSMNAVTRRIGTSVTFRVRGVRIAGVIVDTDQPGRRVLVEHKSGLARGVTRIWVAFSMLEPPTSPPKEPP